MIDHEKLSKLIERMQRLATYLNDRNDLVTHQQVNQFFYMQKTEDFLPVLYGACPEERKLVCILKYSHFRANDMSFISSCHLLSVKTHSEH